jgi:hypothetical protein
MGSIMLAIAPAGGGGAVSIPQLRRLRQVRNRALTRM